MHTKADLDEHATFGETIVAQLLDSLRERGEDLAYAYECEIQATSGGKVEPDYILVLPSIGVAVLEVKDWVNILGGDKSYIHARRRDQEEAEYPNPDKQARAYLHDVRALLEKQPGLLNPTWHKQAGKLKVPCQYFTVLTNIEKHYVSALEDEGILTPNTVICREDIDLLRPQRFLTAIRTRFEDTAPWSLSEPLTAEDVDCIRRALDPDLKILDRAGRSIGTVTQEQEEIIKESPRLNLASLGKPGQQKSRVRVVRGVAGSGKTLLVIYRARHWAKKLGHLEPKILVMAHNLALVDYMREQLSDYAIDVLNPFQLAEEILGEDYHLPIGTGDWIKENFPEPELRHGLPRKFLEHEFEWLKNQREQLDVQEYSSRLKARADGTIQDDQIDHIIAMYALYCEQQELRRIDGERWMDWQDVLREALKRLRQGLNPYCRKYNMVLIDEVQDFTPLAIKLALEVFNPGGEVFLCEDPCQTLWRYYTWEEKGIDLQQVDACTDLRVPYRATYEINVTAYSLLYADPLLATSDNLIKPLLDPRDVMHGPPPILMQCADLKTEIKHVRKFVEKSIKDGVDADSIAILCHSKHDLEHWRAPEHLGVEVNYYDKVKGLEYDTVVLPHLHSAFQTPSSVDQPTFISNIRRRVFVGMTRARQNLLLSYQGDLPVELSPLRGFSEERSREH